MQPPCTKKASRRRRPGERVSMRLGPRRVRRRRRGIRRPRRNRCGAAVKNDYKKTHLAMREALAFALVLLSPCFSVKWNANESSRWTSSFGSYFCHAPLSERSRFHRRFVHWLVHGVREDHRRRRIRGIYPGQEIPPRQRPGSTLLGTRVEVVFEKSPSLRRVCSSFVEFKSSSLLSSKDRPKSRKRYVSLCIYHYMCS